MDNITLENVKNHPKVRIYMKKADEHLEAIGYTEHGERHAAHTALVASKVLEHLKFSKRDLEIVAISGYMHDIGNVLGRTNHGISGAMMADNILNDLGMSPDEAVLVMSAISNHDEECGEPTNSISAALILADKADVHRSRVRNPDLIKFDIHDRVNYAAERSFLSIDYDKKKISLEVTINTTISKVMEYFEIFLSRMIICRRAAKFLKCDFELLINNVKLL